MGKDWCFTESEANGAESGFADKGREGKRAGEEAARAREAGRGAAEHNQQVRVVFGCTSQPGLAADSSSGAGLSQKWSQVNSETIIAAPGKFLYMPGPRFASAFLGYLS